jgi:hypothetical protein
MPLLHRELIYNASQRPGIFVADVMCNWVLIMRASACFLIWCILATSFCNAQKPDTVFLSPMGKFSVSFKLLKHTKTDNPEDIDKPNNIKYQITFTDRHTGASRSLDFFDVYDFYVFNHNQTTPLDTLFRMITWSPLENFAVLPEEAWASAPGTRPRKAINLDSKFKWSSVYLGIDDLVWLDSITVAGDASGDCDLSVLLFDGVTATTDTIQESQSPLGYELRGIKGDSLLIETVLDGCSTEQDRKSFSPRFISLKIGDILSRPSRGMR